MLGLGFCTSLQKKIKINYVGFLELATSMEKSSKICQKIGKLCMHCSHLMAGLYVRTSGSKYSSLNGS